MVAPCIPPAAQQSPWGVAASGMGWQFGEDLFTFEARNHRRLWHFLFIDMTGNIFMSQ